MRENDIVFHFHNQQYFMYDNFKEILVIIDSFDMDFNFSKPARSFKTKLGELWTVEKKSHFYRCHKPKNQVAGVTESIFRKSASVWWKTVRVIE